MLGCVHASTALAQASDPAVSSWCLVCICLPFAEGPQTEWCPKNLTTDGCQQGLTKVYVTPSSTLDDLLPNVCMAMPQVSSASVS